MDFMREGKERRDIPPSLLQQFHVRLRTTNSATVAPLLLPLRGTNDDAALHLHSRICMHKHDNPRVCSCRIFDVDRIVDAAIATFFISFSCTHLKKKGSIFFFFSLSLSPPFRKSCLRLHNFAAARLSRLLDRVEPRRGTWMERNFQTHFKLFLVYIIYVCIFIYMYIQFHFERSTRNTR